MIKCPECGIEYSYGRNLCHACENKTIFHGSIFFEQRKEYAWNCNCTDVKATKPSKKEFPSFLKHEQEESILHPWNSLDSFSCELVPLLQRKSNLLYE
jgi:hypothetical protein